MDVIDKNILTDLILNCRTSYQDMAIKYNLSANAIKKRINNMISKGVIEKFTIQLSLDMIDADILMCIIQTDGTEDEEQFLEYIGNDPRFSSLGRASGNLYIAFAKYMNGTAGLSEIRLFLNKKFVNNIELFPLLMDRGGKIEFSRTELTILKYLMENPRIPISEISNKSGISSKMISTIITDLSERGIVLFSITYSPGTDSILFLEKIDWNDQEMRLNELLEWLPKRFPEDFWIPAGICATEPIVFAAFISNNLARIPEITKRIKENKAVKSVTPIIGQPNKVYPDYSVLKLQELVKDI